MSWHHLPVNEVFKKLATRDEGLTWEEVKEKRKVFGLNKLPEEKKLSIFGIFFNQFKSPLIYVLLAAAFICLLLKEIDNAVVILAAVFLNTLIGFIQEYKAEQSLKKLKKLVEYQTVVVRQGEKKKVSAADLVPGDIILIEAGDKIPADARLIKNHNCEVEEAILTGESTPSIKKTGEILLDTFLADRENMLYMGTIVIRGKGSAVIVETGSRTELGKIALMVKETKEDLTPLQKKMKKLARFLGLVVGFLSFFIFLLGWLTGRDLLEMFLVSVAVAVAAIPEGLIISVTVSLALGMQRILKKKALVRKLVAAETLGSITVICTDKTGTLTEGKMKVSQIINWVDKKFLSEMFFLCHDAILEKNETGLWKISGDSTEAALILFALAEGFDQKQIDQHYQRLDEIPFDSEKMYMATLHQKINNQLPGDRYLFIKGAPEKIIEKSNLFVQLTEETNFSEREKNNLKKEVENLTNQGLRVLAFAYKKTEKNKINENDIDNLVFAGLVALADPLRKDAAQTIEECRQAGVRPIILTGDHKLTALKIAQEIGVATQDSVVIDGPTLDQLDQNQFKTMINQHHIFARVEPRHKIKIVDFLQSQGEVVAMTGDGINDAPALKSADIGVALGSGTDVTKETADLVLLDDNLKTIVTAIKEGRTIFDNIKKIILYLLAGSFSEVLLVAGGLILGLPLPILPAQILWINIIPDSLPAMALTNEKSEKENMATGQKFKREIIDRPMKIMVFLISVITNLVLFALFCWLYRSTNNLFYARTMIFISLAVGSLFFIFSCKNLKKTIFSYNPLNNKFLNWSIIFGLGMSLLAIYLPFLQRLLKVEALRLNDWLIILGFGVFNLMLLELAKFWFIIKSKK